MKSARCCRKPAALLFYLATCGLALSGCAPQTETAEPADAGASAAGPPAAGPLAPEPDFSDMEPQVEKRLRETRDATLQQPLSAEAWGQFGMVSHAHELLEESLTAYRQAEKLDSTDERWPYYLGDVLSIQGTDLDASAAAFRRFMALRKDYAPAHMRLGKVLLADNRPEEAARELERALELEPGLQPARLSLAQIRLAEGELEQAAQMLEEILAVEPRHEQALSTLGQVYMRLGRRDEARQVAVRARDGALYNLFEDPLMAKVVAEGVSSVLVWERAKAFLDTGNDKQAALGLRQVIELQPDNADAHQQLAVAYGNLGELARSRKHLERAVALAPDRVESLIQLATAQLELGEPAAAVGVLQRILRLAPEDPDAGWLLGRAQVLSGNVAAGLASFERAAAKGGEVPVWARNEWGSALAQSGRPEAALEQFRAALRANPQDAQALFYTGLVLEGTGRVDAAVESYCRSMAAQPNPPAGNRLQALGRRCG